MFPETQDGAESDADSELVGQQEEEVQPGDQNGVGGLAHPKIS